MNFKQSFLMAIKSLRNSKMRSFLTMLGIIIGVASVILLTSIVGGLKSYITESVESFGSNMIMVMLTGKGSDKQLEPDDFQQLVDENKSLFSAVSPSVQLSMSRVKLGADNMTTSTVGASESYITINNMEVGKGRFLEYIDIQRRQPSCVIGSYIEKELFDGQNAIGQTIKINGKAFTVIGVLEAKQNSSKGGSDDTIIIPYTVAQRMGKNAMVSSYTFTALSKDTVDAAMDKVTAFLEKNYKDSDSYMALNQADALDMLNDMMSTMSTVLGGIAAISLLVGGIGIMNIMLVSVTERTKEIGIRKSLGAKRRDIMSQFVVEAGTTSAVGGLIGILTGFLLSALAGKLLGFSAIPTVGTIIMAFTVSAAIGIIFGYLPANKAAKLNPIDALRHE